MTTRAWRGCCSNSWTKVLAETSKARTCEGGERRVDPAAVAAALPVICEGMCILGSITSSQKLIISSSSSPPFVSLPSLPPSYAPDKSCPSQARRLTWTAAAIVAAAAGGGGRRASAGAGRRRQGRGGERKGEGETRKSRALHQNSRL